MAEWKIKGVVEDEPKTKQQTEQAVLDKAVEKGEIEPEAAGQNAEETPKINLDAVQEQSADEISVRDESKSSEEVQKENVETQDKNSTGESKEEESPIEIINEEEAPVNNQPKVDERAAVVNEKPQPEEVTPQIELPENIDKLIKFMDDTGGSLEDYVNMNRDVSQLSDGELLRQYYSQSKPWDLQEINEYMEDNFSYSEEEDDQRDIRAKKRAFKEELYNAKSFFKNHKEKYYADLKLSRQ